MKKIRIAILSALTALLSTGCLQYDGDGFFQKQIVPFEIGVSATANETKSTIADEDSDTESINSLHLWAYESGENGNLVQARYFTKEQLSGVELTDLNKGRSYYVIAIVNAGNAESLQAPATRNDLKTMRLSYDNLVGEMKSKGVPMVGHIEALTPTWFQNPVEIEVTRLVSRYDIALVRNFAGEGAFTVTSLELKNSPKSVALIGESKAESGSDVGNGDYSSAADKDKLNNPGTFATFYLLENRQGIVGSITDQSQKIASNLGDKASVCTYFEIKGNYTNKGISRTMTYRLYLGQNMTNDFNVIRNTKNTVTLNLVSEGGNNLQESWRVEGGTLTDNRSIVFSPNPVIVPSKGSASCVVTTNPEGVKYTVSGDGFDDSLTYEESNGTFTFTSKASVATEKTATLTFTSWDGVVLGNLTVKVTPPVVSSIRIVPEGKTAPETWSIPLGGTKMFDVQVAMSDAPETFTTITDTENITWEAVTGVDHITGRVFKGIAKGNAKIKATYQGKEAYSEGTVTDGEYVPNSLTIEPASADVSITATKDFKAYARFTDKEEKVDVTDKCEWSTTDGTYLDINYNSVKGRVHGKAAKDGCVISAKYGSDDRNAIVNIKAKSVKTVYVYSDPEGKHDVGVNGTLSLKVKVDYNNEDLKDVVESIPSSSVTWSVNYSEYASVSNGEVTGKKGGSVTVTAMYGGVSGTYQVNIVKKVVALAITPGKDAVIENRTVVQKGSLSFSAVATYDDSTTGNVTTQVTFSSSNTAIALFNGNVLTGIAEGTVLVGCQYKENPSSNPKVEGSARTEVIVKGGTVTYDNFKITGFSYDIIPAAGGSVSPSEISYSVRQTTTYGAGDPEVKTVTGKQSYATLKEGGSIVVVSKEALNGVSATFDEATGKVSAPSLGTTIVAERNVYRLKVKLRIFDIESEEKEVIIAQGMNEEILSLRQTQEAKSDWKITEFSVNPTSLGRTGGDLIFTVKETYKSQAQYKRHYTSGAEDNDWINDGAAETKSVAVTDVPKVYVKTNPASAATAKSGQKNVFSVAENTASEERTFEFAVKDEAHSVAEKTLSVTQEKGRKAVGLKVTTDVGYNTTTGKEEVYVGSTFNVTGVFVKYDDNTVDGTDIKADCMISITGGTEGKVSRNGFAFTGEQSGDAKVSFKYAELEEILNVEVKTNVIISGLKVYASVPIVDDEITLNVGDSFDITGVHLTFSNNTEGADVKSDATYVLNGSSVGRNGLTFTATSSGTTTITVSYEGKTKDITVVVKSTPYAIEFTLGNGTSLGQTTRNTGSDVVYSPVLFSGETLYAALRDLNSNKIIESRKAVPLTGTSPHSVPLYTSYGFSNTKVTVIGATIKSFECLAPPTASAENYRGQVKLTYTDGSTRTITSAFATEWQRWIYCQGNQTVEKTNEPVNYSEDFGSLGGTSTDWYLVDLMLNLPFDEQDEVSGTRKRGLRETSVSICWGGKERLSAAVLNGTFGSSSYPFTLNEFNSFTVPFKNEVKYKESGIVSSHYRPMESDITIANTSIAKYDFATNTIKAVDGGTTSITVDYGKTAGSKNQYVNVDPWKSLRLEFYHNDSPLGTDWMDLNYVGYSSPVSETNLVSFEIDTKFLQEHMKTKAQQRISYSEGYYNNRGRVWMSAVGGTSNLSAQIKSFSIEETSVSGIYTVYIEHTGKIDDITSQLFVMIKTSSRSPYFEEGSSILDIDLHNKKIRLVPSSSME